MSACPGIPRVDHAILAEGHVEAVREHLRHARHAAPLRIGVVAALDRDVDQRIGDGGKPCFGHQRQELRDIVVVHRMHGGEVRGGDPACQSEPQSFAGQRFDVTRKRIVGFIAMHIDQKSALGGQFAQRPNRSRALGHGALEMRDAADHIHAEIAGREECCFDRCGCDSSRPAETPRAGDRGRGRSSSSRRAALPPQAAGRHRHRHGCGWPTAPCETAQSQ